MAVGFTVGETGTSERFSIRTSVTLIRGFISGPAEGFGAADGWRKGVVNTALEVIKFPVIAVITLKDAALSPYINLSTTDPHL